MTQATVLRRVPDADGAATGDFAPVATLWARWTQNPGVMQAVNGQREDQIDLVVTVNDCPAARLLTNADRMTLAGESFTIASVGLPERRSGTIQLMLSRGVNA